MRNKLRNINACSRHNRSHPPRQSIWRHTLVRFAITYKQKVHVLWTRRCSEFDIRLQKINSPQRVRRSSAGKAITNFGRERATLRSSKTDKYEPSAANTIEPTSIYYDKVCRRWAESAANNVTSFIDMSRNVETFQPCKCRSKTETSHKMGYFGWGRLRFRTRRINRDTRGSSPRRGPDKE